MRKLINKIVSLGAAVVIIGAWAKITHKSYADTLLTIGLITEALIFIMYMFIDEEQGCVINKTETKVDKSEEKLDRIINAFKSI